MDDGIGMSISVDSPSGETLNWSPLALLLRRQHEFPFGINTVQFSNFNFSMLKGLAGQCISSWDEKNENENCTILSPKGNSYCRRKSSARGPQFKVSSEGLSAEIDIPQRSPIQVQTKVKVACWLRWLSYSVECAYWIKGFSDGVTEEYSNVPLL